MDSISPEELDRLQRLRAACEPMGWRVGLALTAKPAGVLGAEVSKADAQSFVIPTEYWDDLIVEDGAPPTPAAGAQARKGNKMEEAA